MAALSSSLSLGFKANVAGSRIAVRPQLRVAPMVAAPIQAGMIGPGKKWESLELNKNGKPVMHKLNVKTGDTVVVIAGKDKGTVGKVTKVLPKYNKVLVEGANIKTRHVKPDGPDDEGSITKIEGVMAASNVMHYSETEKVRSRLGHKVVDGKKVRYLIKTGEVLAN